MISFEQLRKNIIEFRDERDRKQFHNPKDLSIALSIEAWELLENFLWKKHNDCENLDEATKQKVQDELWDILIYLIQLSDNLNIDLLKAANKKMEENKKKYPIEKSKWVSDKYTTF
jgi:dCTP diphosphatase